MVYYIYIDLNLLLGALPTSCLWQLNHSPFNSNWTISREHTEIWKSFHYFSMNKWDWNRVSKDIFGLVKSSVYIRSNSSSILGLKLPTGEISSIPWVRIQLPKQADERLDTETASSLSPSLPRVPESYQLVQLFIPLTGD